MNEPHEVVSLAFEDVLDDGIHHDRVHERAISGDLDDDIPPGGGAIILPHDVPDLVVGPHAALEAVVLAELHERPVVVGRRDDDLVERVGFFETPDDHLKD